MKHIRYVFVVFVFLFFPLSVQALEFDIDSTNAILYNRKERNILYSKNPDEEIPIASLTKIMTAYVAIEHIPNLDEKVTITAEVMKGLVEANASVAGFQIGEVVTYRDLLYGVMLPSGADATRALAINLMGSEENFAGLMNAKAQELHLEHTHFINTSGLDAEGHYSTVRDVATTLFAALENPIFYEIYTAKSYRTSNGRMTLQSTLQRTAKRYNVDISYVLGSKTGTTPAAGLCLSSIAQSEDSEYLLVTAGAPNDTHIPYHILDAKVIYDYFITNFGYYTIINQNDLLTRLQVKFSNTSQIELQANETIKKYLPKDINPEELEYQYHGNKVVTPFTGEGNKVGVFQILYRGDPLKTWEVVMPYHVNFDVLKFLNDTFYIPIALLLIVMIVGILKKMKRKEAPS